MSVVFDLMIHDLELLRFLFGASGKCETAIGFRDMCSARVCYANGLFVDFVSSRVSLRRTRIWRIFEADRYISVDLFTNRVFGFCGLDYRNATDFLEVGNDWDGDPYEELNKRLVSFNWAPERPYSRIELIAQELDDFVRRTQAMGPFGFGESVLSALELADQIDEMRCSSHPLSQTSLSS